MAIALYDAVTPHFRQALGAVRGVLAKGLEHARSKGIDPETLAQARLIEDMFPLYLQVQLVAHHSAGALDNVGNGAFTLPSRDPLTYAAMQQLLADAEARVAAWAAADVNALEGREVVLDLGAARRTFTGQSFFTTFSLPNLYFHAVTAYDILRAQGVPIGKRDFLVGLAG